MNDSPCYFSISRIHEPGQAEIVRITCADKVRPIVIVDLEARDWSNAMFGDSVIAAISTGRAV